MRLCSTGWILCLLLSACGQPKSVTPKAATHIIWGVCPGAEVSSIKSQCGRFYPSPDHPAIYIAFAVLSPLRATPLDEPVLYLSGGPGQGGNTLAASVNAWRYRIVDAGWNRSVVLWDSRGNEGAWGAFDCEAYRQLSINQLAGHLGNPDDEERIAKNCLAHWQTQLANTGFTQFNTEQNAQDVLALMQSLGYDSWHLMSVSYGSRVAEWMQALAPQHIHSLLIDSPYSWQLIDRNDKTLQWQQSLETFFAFCAEAQTHCGSAQLAALFWQVVDALSAQSIKLKYPLQGYTETALIDGAQFAHVFFSLLYNANNYPQLADMLVQLKEGKTQLFEQMAAPLLAASLRPDASPWLYWITECNDNTAQTLTDVELGWQAMAKRWQPLLGVDTGVHICAWANVLTAANAPPAPATVVPTIILAGQQDPVAPALQSELMAKQRKALFLLAEHHGHGLLAQGVCNDDWLETFWRSPASFVANTERSRHNFGRCTLSAYSSPL